jgi:hypothetical protein
MGVNLVTSTNELKSHSFLVLMSLRVCQGEFKPQVAKQPPIFILDSFNKFLEVIANELHDALPPYKEVDYKKWCLDWPYHPMSQP